MFYIIYGDDNYRCHEALSQIKVGLGSPDMVNINTTTLDGRKLTVRELSEVCDAMPFMAPNRLIIVNRLLKRFQAGEKQASNGEEDSSTPLKEWQGIAGYVKTMPPTTVLVFFDTEIDAKSHNPLIRTLTPASDKVLQLNEIKGRELTAWIRDYTSKNGGKMSVAAVNLLADYIGGDLWTLEGEINKLIVYCMGRDITDNDVREITSFAREENIFALVDGVLEGRIKQAQHMLHRMLGYGTAPQQILAMIERQLIIIMRVKDVGQNVPLPQIKERLGLHPRYPLDKTLKQSRAFTLSRLRRAFHCLLDTDVAIKTGRYDDDLALDMLVIELCRNRQ